METLDEKVNRSIQIGNDIRSKLTYWAIFGIVVVSMHEYANKVRVERIEKKVDTIVAVQEQCTQLNAQENDTWYLIKGQRAYVQIEGKPTEQYLMEKQNE